MAAMGNQSVPLFPSGQDTFAGILGIDVDAAIGTQTVHVTTIDAGGSASTAAMPIEVRDGLFREETIELDEHAGDELGDDIRQQEYDMLQQLWSEVTGERLWQGAWSPPITGTVSSPFGTKRTYTEIEATGRHSGMDFRGSPETPVHAPARGRVAFAGPLAVRGNAVWLDHGWGIYTGYFHLSEIKAEMDTILEQGDVLGTVGATGMTTGPHLHWEVRVHSMAVQPLQWLLRDVGAVP
jgi:murein DD-endopeptidase MepM/ murein hydrolase activator NlpD